MSSAASTDSTFRPWQFFVLAALLVATAGVFLSRGTSPANIILVSLVIGAASFVGIAVYRTLAPLTTPEGSDSTQSLAGRTRAALEQEKALVLRSIKELEFDRAMRKLSEHDYEEMVARLRARAVRLIRQLDAGQSGYRELIERELASRMGRAIAAKQSETTHPVADPAVDDGADGDAGHEACADCGTTNETDARFCKHCGARIAAALVWVVAMLFGSALALAQPDLRMMTGIPRPDGDLADGTITVRVVRQALANNVTGHPVELRTPDGVMTGMTDDDGRVTFRDASPGTVVRAATVVDGESLESQEFPAPARGGVAVMLVAGLGALPSQAAQPGTVSIDGGSRVVVDLVDERLEVYYIFGLLNRASYPVNPSMPVMFDLPTGAAAASALSGSSPQVVVRGDRVTVTGPFAPGVTPVEVGYTLPHSSGDLVISQELPVAMEATTVIVRRVGAMGLTSAQLADQQERTLEGEQYIMGVGPAIEAGGVLRLNLSGLPHDSTIPRSVAGLLAGLIVLVGAWAAFSGTEQAPELQKRRRQLEARREKAYAELLKLESQRRERAIDPARHQSRRTTLIAQLEHIYGELDSQGLTAGGDEGLVA